MIEKAKFPEYCPGCYSLHLYCDHVNPNHRYDEFPWEIDGFETGAQARKYAKSKGWKLHRDGTATCPKCVRELKKV